ncbi:MAG: uracil-DNA glycosylase [Ignavibacteriales bacterium]|nr:uracil-DNA glycosylase [Ignavibacteriales bacterium]
MPTPQEEFDEILSNAEKYLKQEKELYGDIVFVGKPEAGVKTPSPTPAVAEKSEVDLFGNRVEASVKKVSEPAVFRYPNEPWVAAQSLDELNRLICNCTKCPLGFTRTKFVFGVGNPKAEIVIVGEAPGADEDAQGEPFVGRAGQLLNKILEAIRFKREEVYICNILKCRPPNNRDPQPEEIDACEPHLWRQLEIIKPKLILCLGRIAAQVLMKTNASLSQLRGKVHEYHGIKLMVTYHPAALLRNPNWKRPTWEDVQVFRKMYDEMKK